MMKCKVVQYFLILVYYCIVVVLLFVCEILTRNMIAKYLKDESEFHTNKCFLCLPIIVHSLLVSRQ